MRKETEDAARLVGLDITVDALFNGRCEVAGLMVGDPVLAHHEGVGRAKEVYATEVAREADIVVTNASRQGERGDDRAGDCAALCQPVGQRHRPHHGLSAGAVVHYLMRRFGKEYGGRQYATRGGLPPQFRVIVLNPQPDLTCTPGPRPGQRHLGEGLVAGDDHSTRAFPREARVAVYPDGTAQSAAAAPAAGRGVPASGTARN